MINELLKGIILGYVTTEKANDLEKAILLAVSAHNGINDKTELPSILHPMRVMLAFSKSPSFEVNEYQIVAILHDVVEDTPITLEDLEKVGFSPNVIRAIDAITRRDGEYYHNKYIKRLAENDVARVVKMFDLYDNINRDDGLDEKKKESLKKRYKEAFAFLFDYKETVLDMDLARQLRNMKSEIDGSCSVSLGV